MWRKIEKDERKTLEKMVSLQKKMNHYYDDKVTIDYVLNLYERKKTMNVWFYEDEEFRMNMVLKKRPEKNEFRLQTIGLEYIDKMIRQNPKKAAIIMLTKMKELIPEGFSYYGVWDSDNPESTIDFFSNVANDENAKSVGFNSVETEKSPMRRGGYKYFTTWK